MPDTTIPSLTKTEMLILGLLIREGGQLFGLQLVDLSEGSLKRGGIYVLLSRMEQKGFVTSELEPASAMTHPGKRRRLYQPTGLGERVYTFTRDQQQTWAAVSAGGAIAGALS